MALVTNMRYDIEVPIFVLQFPNIACQGGADPLLAVPHVGLVSSISLLSGELPLMIIMDGRSGKYVPKQKP